MPSVVTVFVNHAACPPALPKCLPLVSVAPTADVGGGAAPDCFPIFKSPSSTSLVGRQSEKQEYLVAVSNGLPYRRQSAQQKYRYGVMSSRAGDALLAAPHIEFAWHGLPYEPNLEHSSNRYLSLLTSVVFSFSFYGLENKSAKVLITWHVLGYDADAPPTE